ncbi:MAG: hypothetical protein JO170_03000 [Verrucomicrobia bacterium]|nr:hypothetical protein [Verrucomicrobiota bacterium]
MSLTSSPLSERKKKAEDITGNRGAITSTNESAYPRWEREDGVSRFLIGPSLPIYQIEEIRLIGGSMFVASALDTSNLVGQFESERNAKEACKRDFADKNNDPAAEAVGWGLNPRQKRR